LIKQVQHSETCNNRHKVYRWKGDESLGNRRSLDSNGCDFAKRIGKLDLERGFRIINMKSLNRYENEKM